MSLILSKQGKIWIRFCPYTGKYRSDKPVFWHISRSVLLNIFIHNLDLRENISFVSVRKLFICEYMNCLTCAKIKGTNINRAKIRGARNLIGSKYAIAAKFCLPKNCFIYFNKSFLKMMKNASHFILKALFVLKIFKFLP